MKYILEFFAVEISIFNFYFYLIYNLQKETKKKKKKKKKEENLNILKKFDIFVLRYNIN